MLLSHPRGAAGLAHSAGSWRGILLGDVPRLECPSGEILSRTAVGLSHTTLTSAFPVLSLLLQLLLRVIYSSTQPSKPVPEIREEESSLGSECPRAPALPLLLLLSTSLVWW